MKKTSLNGKWNLSGHPHSKPDEKIELTATVPGCVQLDLSAAGHLPKDLFKGENIVEAEKYETWEWDYVRTFTAPESRKNLWLVFRGVDCVADYYLNGTLIGKSGNMLIPHSFFICDTVKCGENELRVHIYSPTVEAHKTPLSETSLYHGWIIDPYSVNLRRAPHSYGWDIMPRAVTHGLWRDVYIEERDEFYFRKFNFFLMQNGSQNVFLSFDIGGDIEKFTDMEIETVCEFKGETYTRRVPLKYMAGKITVGIKNPKLWWPYGYGEPNIYDATIRLYKKGVVVHEEKTHFGIRKIELDRTDSTDGVHGKFRLLVNGVEIFVKGSSWVPLDVFHSRDAEKYEKALALAKDLGCNILRCWGGNVYEDHEFFDFCDRNGIMVWQDFAMACNYYPQTEKFFAEMREEIISFVGEYNYHPSITVWSGDNEVDRMNELGGLSPSYNRITREVIPNAIREIDLVRPYLISSPYVSDEVFAEKKMLPENHLWGVRDYYKAAFYKNDTAHFVSETGYHGCPARKSLEKFLSEGHVTLDHDNDPEWILHSSDQRGNNGRVVIMKDQVRQLFGEVPAGFDDFVLASQISQAEADKYFIEHMRVQRPIKSGIIWWNILDGWPQTSDAIVDYYFEKKLAYGYIKHAQAPFIMTIDEHRNRNGFLFACNDTQSAVSGSYTVTDVENGEVVAEGEFEIGANTSKPLVQIPIMYSAQKMFKIEWTANKEKGFNHYFFGLPAVSFEKYKELMKKCGL